MNFGLKDVSTRLRKIFSRGEHCENAQSKDIFKWTFYLYIMGEIGDDEDDNLNRFENAAKFGRVVGCSERVLWNLSGRSQIQTGKQIQD